MVETIFVANIVGPVYRLSLWGGGTAGDIIIVSRTSPTSAQYAEQYLEVVYRFVPCYACWSLVMVMSLLNPPVVLQQSGTQ
jgi:hypothetical protein